MGIEFDVKAQQKNYELMRVLKPIGTARGLPNTCYIDPAVFTLEQRRGFADG